MADVHKVLLEEFLQLSLRGRVGEVSDVESPPLGGTGDDSLILGCVDGLVAGALGSAGGLGEGGVGHLGSGRFNGHDVEVGVDDTKCTGVSYIVWEYFGREVLRVRLRNCGCPDFARWWNRLTSYT